jgi:hypothetical protein
MAHTLFVDMPTRYVVTQIFAAYHMACTTTDRLIKRGGLLADINIQAAEGLAPLHQKMKRRSLS